MSSFSSHASCHTNISTRFNQLICLGMLDIRRLSKLFEDWINNECSHWSSFRMQIVACGFCVVEEKGNLFGAGD
ncbi:hypothetical protein I7I53_09486 [Histoplasma capsulatum var. duboisii H88]|uniref:Uncharacterized protein n=1 Tax=Ajellomyces capsulatus (strain H88) TaxID=544711 RepID=A0A8A1L940_AJEC8|nr:hypothetical protein I7I53_09486 [Histoplasma capsulatum var. duboisii H88]